MIFVNFKNKLYILLFLSKKLTADCQVPSPSTGILYPLFNVIVGTAILLHQSMVLNSYCSKIQIRMIHGYINVPPLYSFYY